MKLLKRPSRKWKNNPHNGRGYPQIIYEIGFVSRIHKELLKPNKKWQPNSKWLLKIDVFQRRYTDGQLST